MLDNKVISLFGKNNYTDFFTGVNSISKEQDIFLNCHRYEIILKIKKKLDNNLNIFETTILKLLAYNRSYTPNDIAQKIGLKIELVRFVIQRLKELNLIDEKKNLTNKAEEYLKGFSEKDEELETKRMNVFVNKFNGELLPYIHNIDSEEDLIEMVAEQKAKDLLKVTFGNAGNSKYIEGFYVDNRTSNQRYIDQYEIKKLIQRYNKVAKFDDRFDEIVYDQNYHIDICNVDDVILHLKSLIQDGNIDYTIFSDGFVFSLDSVSKCIKLEFPEIIDNIKKSANKSEQDDNISSDKYDKKQSKKYDDLHHRLEFIQKQKIYAKTPDELKQQKEDNNNNMLNCYYAIILALDYHYRDNKLKKQPLQNILNNSSKENSESISKFLNNHNIEKHKDTIKIDTSKINHYIKSNEDNKINKDIELDTIIGLCLLEASENEKSKIINLINEQYDLFGFLEKLKKDVRSLRHTNKNIETTLDINKVSKKTLLIINTLLMDFEKENNIKKNKLNISQSRLNAQNSLSNEIGYEFFYSLDESIKDELCKISSDKTNDKLPRYNDYVICISKSAEMILLDYIENMNISSNINKETLINDIQSMFNMRLSKTLTTIREDNIIKALKKQKSTLGAYTLIVLRFIDHNARKMLIERNFIKDISKIIDLRGHGNKNLFNYEYKELSELKINILNTLKLLGGYND
ncbi:MAG: hypothetical protein RR942_08770 [Romboutsia sp.]